jgi:Mg2+-importing ATPase
VKILTGDSELVAAKVCHEVGLDAGEVVIGSQIEAMSDDELAALAKRTTLFARLAPLHKERIVTLLKREGHVVGFMGDGINDARRCARRISASRLMARWISPARRRISFCWKKA